MNKVVVVGDCSIDNFIILDNQDASLIKEGKLPGKLCFAYGEKISIDQRLKFYGGSALNVACGFKKLGLDVDLVSIVGADAEGREIIDFLNDQQVNLDNVKIKEDSNQAYIFIYKKERTIFSYHRPRKYSDLKIPKSDLIYLSSVGEGGDGLVNKIRSAAASGAKLIFNPGSFELSHFDDFRSLLALTSVLLINASEAEILTGEAKKRILQLEKLINFGTKIAIITDGKNGAYFGTPEGNFHMHIAPSNTVDLTGAGDAFACALTAALAKGKSLEEAAIWGAINSASVIEEYGANSNLLDTAEIDKKNRLNKILKFSRLKS